MNTNDLIFTKDNEGNIISGGYNINSLFTCQITKIDYFDF